MYPSGVKKNACFRHFRESLDNDKYSPINANLVLMNCDGSQKKAHLLPADDRVKLRALLGDDDNALNLAMLPWDSLRLRGSIIQSMLTNLRILQQLVHRLWLYFLRKNSDLGWHNLELFENFLEFLQNSLRFFLKLALICRKVVF